VRTGLKPGDTIVVNGLMRVRPGMQVSPQLIAMGERRNADGSMVAQNATHDAGPANGGSATRENR
jgi:hypothetical protein